MSRNVLFGLVALALSGLVATEAKAQEDLLAELYGRGVHAYFAKDYVEAHEQFTAAIDGGSTDPRCFYFRGLTYVKLGRPEESKEDFARGAALEVTGEQFYPIGRSLERIRGTTRLQLEKIRLQARIEVRQREKEEKDARYGGAGSFEKSQERVLRKQPTPDFPEQPDTTEPDTTEPDVTEPDTTEPPGDEVDPTNPFGEDKTDPFDTGKIDEPGGEPGGEKPDVDEPDP